MRKNTDEDSCKSCNKTTMLDKIALILLIIGGVNWGSVGLFRFDIVSWICGGSETIVARIIYTLVGISALWCISLLFRKHRDHSRID